MVKIGALHQVNRVQVQLLLTALIIAKHTAQNNFRQGVQTSVGWYQDPPGWGWHGHGMDFHRRPLGNLRVCVTNAERRSFSFLFFLHGHGRAYGRLAMQPGVHQHRQSQDGGKEVVLCCCALNTVRHTSQDSTTDATFKGQGRVGWEIPDEDGMGMAGFVAALPSSLRPAPTNGMKEGCWDSGASCAAAPVTERQLRCRL